MGTLLEEFRAASLFDCNPLCSLIQGFGTIAKVCGGCTTRRVSVGKWGWASVVLGSWPYLRPCCTSDILWLYDLFDLSVPQDCHFCITFWFLTRLDLLTPPVPGCFPCWGSRWPRLLALAELPGAAAADAGQLALRGQWRRGPAAGALVPAGCRAMEWLEWQKSG